MTMGSSPWMKRTRRQKIPMEGSPQCPVEEVCIALPDSLQNEPLKFASHSKITVATGIQLDRMASANVEKTHRATRWTDRAGSAIWAPGLHWTDRMKKMGGGSSGIKSDSGHGGSFNRRRKTSGSGSNNLTIARKGSMKPISSTVRYHD
jgi:hypothetical protein